jgi:hypothetical protein
VDRSPALSNEEKVQRDLKNAPTYVIITLMDKHGRRHRQRRIFLWWNWGLTEITSSRRLQAIYFARKDVFFASTWQFPQQQIRWLFKSLRHSLFHQWFPFSLIH